MENQLDCQKITRSRRLGSKADKRDTGYQKMPNMSSRDLECKGAQRTNTTLKIRAVCGSLHKGNSAEFLRTPGCANHTGVLDLKAVPKESVTVIRHVDVERMLIR